MKILKFGDRIRTITEPGSMYKIVYGSKIDKKGNIIVEPKSKENWYEKIQADADASDINTILAKYTAGDTSVLNSKQGSYLDITNIPDNYADILNQINEAQNIFNSLPIEKKEKFEFNLNKFLSTLNTPEWLDIMNDKNVIKNNEKEMKGDTTDNVIE